LNGNIVGLVIHYLGLVIEMVLSARVDAYGLNFQVELIWDHGKE